MGLLKHLLFWPVTGPSFLTRFSLEKVSDTVREELTNDQAIKEDLLALQMQLELGEIDDEEYVRQEMELMRRLREVREWREEYGMGTSGGPVRVAGSAPEEGQVAREGVGARGASEATGEGGDHEPPRPAGIMKPEGASIEVNLDWES